MSAPAVATAAEGAMRIILVHGGWCWYRVATLLRAAGHRVDAPDLAASGAEARYVAARKVYVVCEQDQALVEPYQRAMVAACPVAEVREIAGADHMAMFSAPAELAGHIADVANTYA